MDMSKVGVRGGVDVVMMPRMPDQHPGVVTTKIKVGRITGSSGYISELMHTSLLYFSCVIILNKMQFEN